MRNLIRQKKLTSIALASTLLAIIPFSLACDSKKIARTSLKASQDVQLFINNFTSAVVEAEKKGFVSHEKAASFKAPLGEFINYNEFLNNLAIDLSRRSVTSADKDALLQALSNMLINLGTLEGMALLHVSNPNSVKAIRALLVAVRTTISSTQVMILKG